MKNESSSFTLAQNSRLIHRVDCELERIAAAASSDAPFAFLSVPSVIARRDQLQVINPARSHIDNKIQTVLNSRHFDSPPGLRAVRPIHKHLRKRVFQIHVASDPRFLAARDLQTITPKSRPVVPCDEFDTGAFKGVERVRHGRSFLENDKVGLAK
jgi:hypothetical protein